MRFIAIAAALIAAAPATADDAAKEPDTKFSCFNIEQEHWQRFCGCTEFTEDHVKRLQCFDDIGNDLEWAAMMARARAATLASSPGGIDAMRGILDRIDGLPD